MSPSPSFHNEQAANDLQQDASAPVPCAVPSGPETVPAADPELARIVAAWPTLPEAIKVGILAMVGAAER